MIKKIMWAIVVMTSIIWALVLGATKDGALSRNPPGFRLFYSGERMEIWEEHFAAFMRTVKKNEQHFLHRDPIMVSLFRAYSLAKSNFGREAIASAVIYEHDKRCPTNQRVTFSGIYAPNTLVCVAQELEIL